MLPQTILVSTDFGEPSDAALDYAVDLAKALRAEVVLMHAFEIPTMSFPDGAIVATAELTSRILEGAQAGLDKQAARHEASGVSIKKLIEQNDPWRAVMATVDSVRADLVVMGTHGRRGLPRAILGSVAEKVVRHSPIPVLVVHAHDRAVEKAAPEAEHETPRQDAAVPASRH